MSASCYTDLKEHIGHNIRCVQYGDGDNVAVECEDCHVVLLDYDKPKYIIFSPSEGYWNNEDGFVDDPDEATIFDGTSYNLPHTEKNDARWEALKPPRNTVVSFVRHVIVERSEYMTEDEIKQAAVDLYNDPPGGIDDMYVSDVNIVCIDHEEME